MRDKMDKFQLANEHYKLERFYSWLTYGLYSSVLLLIAIFLPLIVSLPIISIVVIGFSVYIIRTLIQFEKKPWIILYAIIIGIPLLLAVFFSNSEIVGNVVWFFPISMFFLYCVLLRHSIIEWISDTGDGEGFRLREKHDEQVKKMMDDSRKDTF
jgi:hypothetical protein